LAKHGEAIRAVPDTHDLVRGHHGARLERPVLSYYFFVFMQDF
jgi:hypothetical protein